MKSKKIEKIYLPDKVFKKKFHPSKNKKPLTGLNTLLGHIFVLCSRLTVNSFKFGKPYCTSNICYVCCFCLTFFNQLSHLKIKNVLFSKPIEMKKMHWGHLFMKLFKALTAHDLSLVKNSRTSHLNRPLAPRGHMTIASFKQ